jgi:hypothetical protein
MFRFKSFVVISMGLVILLALLAPQRGYGSNYRPINATKLIHQIRNLNHRGPETIDSVREISNVFATSEVIFYDGFESGSLGADWSTETTNNGRVQVATTYPYTGIYSLLLDNAVDDSTYSIASAILTVDLSGISEASLDLVWREFGDEDHSQDGIFLSDDNGANWYLVWSFNGNYGSTWQPTVIDLDAQADLAGLSFNDHFKIKFQYYDNYAIDQDGYAIDEVTVTSYPAPIPASVPFYDGFETGELSENWVADFTRDGRIRVTTDYPYAGYNSLLLDDGGDPEYSLAMATLSLDLSGVSQAELDFFWREFNDEDHPEDGVFISDDDGENWYQVYSFNGTRDYWTLAVIDIDDEASQQGVSLNEHFQIKFQFYDNSPINQDGYAIDEVRVRVLNTSTFPFEEDFETGSLGPAWQIEKTDSGRVEVSSSYPHTDTYCLLLDDSGGSNYSYAAGILSLDLSPTQQPLLEFYWREFEDEDHEGDGVFIRDDQGAIWAQIVSFNGDHGAVWQHQLINLVEAANTAGVLLTNGFQIKFQFYDNSAIDQDGYAIDDIRVRSNEAPELSWIGTGGYESDGLEPEAGNSRDTYIYRIQYSDPDNDSPGSLQTHILSGASEIIGSPFEMSCTGIDYQIGVDCSFEANNLTAGLDYSYYFTGQDNQGNLANPTEELNGPTITAVYWIELPLIAKNVGPPSNPPTLDPISNTGGDYEFKVSWSDVNLATRYTLDEATDSSFTDSRIVYSGSQTSAQISVSQTGTYYYRVQASNDFGETGWSNVVSTQVTVAPPPCPQTGEWSGTTSQGTSIYFDISDSPSCRVENLTISYYICVQKVWTDFYEYDSIFNDHFYLGGSTGNVSGDFTTDTFAEGDFYFEIMCPGDPPLPDFSEGTWSASP